MKKLLYFLKFILKPIEKRRDYHLFEMKSIYSLSSSASIYVDYKKPINKQFESIIEKLQQYSLHLAKIIDSRLLSYIQYHLEIGNFLHFISTVKREFGSQTAHWFLDLETKKPRIPNIIPLEQYEKDPLSMGIVNPIKVNEIKLLRDHLLVTLENCDELYFQIKHIPNYSINPLLEKELIRKDIKNLIGK